jgi:hypothetical protein
LPLIARLSEDDRRVAALYVNLDRELARAHAGLGEHTAAAQVIDAALARYADSDHPLLLGNLHSTAAAVAIEASDYARATEHARQVEHWFRATDNPVLIAHTEKLLRRVRSASGAPPEDRSRVAPDGARTQDAAPWQTGLSELSQLRAEGERAAEALRLTLVHTRSQAGFLFAVDDREPQLIAPRHGEEPAEGLLERVRVAARGGTQLAAASVAETQAPRVDTRDTSYAIYALEDDDSEHVVGVVAIERPTRAFRAPRMEFLRALSRALFPKASTQTREEQIKQHAGP